MLRIFDNHKKSIGVFNHYDSLLGIITSVENQKLLEGRAALGLGYWSFAYYTPEQFKHVCAWIKPGFLKPVQLKALEQGLGLLEIYRGNSAAVQETPVTADLDVEDFKKKFCLDYCRQRGWRLIETLGHNSSQQASVGKRRCAVHPHTRKSRLAQMTLNNVRGRRMRAELDSRIERLRQKHLAANLAPTPTPIHTPPQKGEF